MSESLIRVAGPPPKIRKYYPSTVLGVCCNVALVALFAVSVGLCVPIIQELHTYKRFGIYIFLGSLLCIILTVTLLTWLVFFKHQHHGLPNILVFMYLLLEVVLVCIAWNLDLDAIHYWTLFALTCLVFAILFIYTCALSKSYFDWRERVLQWELKVIDLKIESERYGTKGPCIHIPLKGPLPDYLKKNPSSSSEKDPGPSTSQETIDQQQRKRSRASSTSRPTDLPDFSKFISPNPSSSNAPGPSQTLKKIPATSTISSQSTIQSSTSSVRTNQTNPGPSTSSTSPTRSNPTNKNVKK